MERETKSPSTNRRDDYTMVIHSGQKASSGKQFKRSIKVFLVKLKANVIPYGLTLLCSETEAFSLGKTGGAIRRDVHE